MKKILLQTTLTIILSFVNVSYSLGMPPSRSAAPDPASKARLMDTYGKLPLSFEPNQGQINTSIDFLARGRGYDLFLTPSEALLVFRKVEPDFKAPPVNRGQAKAQGTKATIQTKQFKQFLLQMQLIGANPKANATGLEKLSGKTNYFIGKDPKKWRPNIPNYARVQYKDVYPGVDLIYYGNQRQLEYDFVIAPGVNPSVIRLAFNGAKKISIDEKGQLILKTTSDDDVILLHAPVIYQEIKGKKKYVLGHYVLLPKIRADEEAREVGFQVAAYDVTKPLIIDPELSYSTFLGGSGEDQGLGIAISAGGGGAEFAFVTGTTSSTSPPNELPMTSSIGAPYFHQSPNSVFVTSFNRPGTSLRYSTYIGGTGTDIGTGIAVDDQLNAYVIGYTNSADFPVVLAGSNYDTNSGGFDAFVLKLNTAGDALAYSMYLGGSGMDIGWDIAAYDMYRDGLGHWSAYVTGYTDSTNFPISGGFTLPGSRGAFVARLMTGSGIVAWSNVLGGLNDEGRGIAVDNDGDAYVSGFTYSLDFQTTPNAFQPEKPGGLYDNDAFVTKINAIGDTIIYSTYLGGSGDDGATAVAVDSGNNAYVTGNTGSDNFPTTDGAFQTALSSSGEIGFDAFVTKLNTSGSDLLYSTYLGGPEGEEANDITVDQFDSAYVTGHTFSVDFPTTAPLPATSCMGGVAQVFLTKLAPLGTGLIYSTCFGGSGYNLSQSIAVDNGLNAYVTGTTYSPDFPTISAYDDTHSGGPDVFITKVAHGGSAQLEFSQSAYVVSESIGSATIAVRRLGSLSGAVSVFYATSDGTASSLDYVATFGTLDWVDGEILDKTFDVTIKDDNFVEGNETINLTLSNPTGDAVLGTQAAATLTITANDEAPVTGVLQFSHDLYAISEDAGSVDITVTRSSGSEGQISVEYRTSDQSATAGEDYTTALDTLTWADGNTDDQTFTIPVLDDNDIEGHETLTLELFGAWSPATSQRTAELMIYDNESVGSGILQFSDIEYICNEGDGVVNITVNRQTGSAGTVIVNYSTSNISGVGMASEGEDYTRKSGTLEFAPGDTFKVITVEVIDDSTDEFEYEEFFVTLSDPTNGAVLGTISKANVKIGDNDISSGGNDQSSNSSSGGCGCAMSSPEGEITIGSLIFLVISATALLLWRRMRRR
jgi:hypothetical protein